MIPGSIAEVPGAKVTDAPNQFLPVNNSSTVAAAALNVLWPGDEFREMAGSGMRPAGTVTSPHRP